MGTCLTDYLSIYHKNSEESVTHDHIWTSKIDASAQLHCRWLRLAQADTGLAVIGRSFNMH